MPLPESSDHKTASGTRDGLMHLTWQEASRPIGEKPDPNPRARFLGDCQEEGLLKALADPEAGTMMATVSVGLAVLVAI